MPEPRTFHFVPGSQFTCNSCGKCCSSDFEIPLQDSKVALIKESSSYKSRVERGYQPLRVVADTFYSLGSNKAGQCHFLEENLCGLHKHEGLSHKPVICQIYPYNLVQTPDGVQVSLLYSCPSVVEGQGAPIEQSRDFFLELFESHQGRIPVLGPIQDHILVTQESTVTWEQYLVLEGRLWGDLTDDDPVAYLLNAALSLATPNPERACFDQTSEHFESVMAGPFRELSSSIWAYLKGLDEDEAIGLHQPESPTVRNAIRCFLRDQIEGKLLVIGPSLVARLVLTACAVAILLHELKARGPVFKMKDLQESFAFIEEKLVSQSNDLDEAFMEFEEYLLEQS
jgi:Fe-S-cluster containining protein